MNSVDRTPVAIIVQTKYGKHHFPLAPRWIGKSDEELIREATELHERMGLPERPVVVKPPDRRPRKIKDIAKKPEKRIEVPVRRPIKIKERIPEIRLEPRINVTVPDIHIPPIKIPPIEFKPTVQVPPLDLTPLQEPIEEWSKAFRTAFPKPFVGESPGLLEDFVTWIVGQGKWLATQFSGGIKAIADAVSPIMGEVSLWSSKHVKRLFDYPTEYIAAFDDLKKVYEDILETIEDNVKKASPATSPPGQLPSQTLSFLTKLALSDMIVEGVGTGADLMHPSRATRIIEFLRQIGRTLGIYGIVSTMMALPIQIGLYEPLRYHYNATFTPAVLDTGTLVQAYFRGRMELKELKEHLAKHGWSSEAADDYIDVVTPIPTVRHLIALRAYDYIDEKAYVQGMGKFGWSEEDAKLIVDTRMRYPYYSMIMEAYRYGHITLEEVKEQLRHRAFHPDVIDEMADVAKKRKEDYEKRERARLFRTIAKRERAKDDIIALYQAREMTREEALDLLQDYEYSLDEATWELEYGEVQERRRERTLSQSMLSARFRAGLMTEDEYRSRLLAMDYPLTAANQIVELDKVRKEERPLILTPAQWARAYQLRIVDEKEFTDYLNSRNMPERQQEILKKLYAPKKPKPPKKVKATVGISLSAPLKPRIVKKPETSTGLVLEVSEPYVPKKITKRKTTVGLEA